MKTMQAQAVNSGERLAFPSQVFLQMVCKFLQIVCKTCSLHLKYLMFCPSGSSALLPVPDSLGLISLERGGNTVTQ